MVAGRPFGSRSAGSPRGARRRSTGRGVPAASLTDLRGERRAQLRSDESGGFEDGRKANAVLDSHAVEEVHEVLRREVAGRSGSERAATGAAGRRVEARDAGVQAGD